MGGSRRRWKRLLRPGGTALARRRASMVADRVVAGGWKRFGPALTSVPLEGEVRLALVTVNFSTTRYLKLLLLTLTEQEHLGLVHDVVIVDNGSRDGGREFASGLAARVPRVHVVPRRGWLLHGPGMRAGVRALDHVEADRPPANVLLFCDADVVFRSADALGQVAAAVLDHGAALVGEVRSGVNPEPDIQASFFAVRRDVHARRDLPPLVHDGSPAYRLQRGIWDAGLPVAHLPTNHGGLVLHRGRAGVEAAARHRPRHQYADVTYRHPHYMGVREGPRVWATIEQRYEDLLEPAAEAELLDTLTERFRRLGTSALTP